MPATRNGRVSDGRRSRSGGREGRTVEAAVPVPAVAVLAVPVPAVAVLAVPVPAVAVLAVPVPAVAVGPFGHDYVAAATR